MKTLASVCFLLLLVTAEARAVDLSEIPRQIMREPAYQSQPRYCLTVFGPEADTHVWLVHDGKTLFVDLDADGDLTEPAERFSSDELKFHPGTLRFDIGDIRVGDRLHKSLSVGVMKLDHLAGTQPDVAETLAKDPEARFYRVSLHAEILGRRGNGLGGRLEQQAGTIDANGALVFSERIDDAPIIHFGSSSWQITPYGHLGKLIAGREQQVYLSVGTPGVGKGTTAFVAYQDLVPENVSPRLTLTFPGNGDAERTHKYKLTQRCCTINFYGAVHIPDDIPTAEASVTVSFSEWIGGLVAPSTQRVEIVTPRKVSLRPISPRLKSHLVHPRMGDWIGGIQFSPDGQRLIAGDYPGGIVQVWDVETGEQLTTIETGHGYRGRSDYIHVTPDWESLFVSRTGRDYTRFERDGKRWYRWEFDGDVRVWNLDTGGFKHRFQHDPPHGIVLMRLAPNGRYFLTGDELPGEYEAHAKRTATLWDATTGRFHDLDGSQAYGVFSPDSRLVATMQMSDDWNAAGIQMYDTSTAARLLSIPVEPDLARLYLLGFTSDSSMLIGRVNEFSQSDAGESPKFSLHFWDAVTGEHTGSVALHQSDYFSDPAYSPDGTLLAMGSCQGERADVRLMRVANRELTRIDLDGVNETDGHTNVTVPVFSPDGHWLVVATNFFPDDVSRRQPAPEDLPQPRVHLIDVAAGKVREVLVTPQAIIDSIAFSPDGRMLATGGNGRVLLWDLSTPPGQAASADQ